MKYFLVFIVAMLAARGGMWLQKHSAWEIDVGRELSRIELYDTFCINAGLGPVTYYDKYSFKCSSGVEIRTISLSEQYLQNTTKAQVK